MYKTEMFFEQGLIILAGGVGFGRLLPVYGPANKKQSLAARADFVLFRALSVACSVRDVIKTKTPWWG